MLDYYLYLLLCCLLGCFSFNNQLTSIIKEPYRLNQPGVLEKLGLYVLWEFIKIIIITTSSLTFSYPKIICCLGLMLYFFCFAISYNFSQVYIVFFLWSLTFLLHPQTFQLSLAVFISCFLLTGKKSTASQVTNYLFPMCLVIASANMYLTLTCLVILTIQAGKNFLMAPKIYN